MPKIPIAIPGANGLALHCAVRGQSRQAAVILGALRRRLNASPEDRVVEVAAKAASATFEWRSVLWL